MITKALAEAVINKADENSLREFATIAVFHLIDGFRYDDRVATNALEVISGVSNGYTNEHIDINKAITYIQTRGYKGENVKEAKIAFIDNLLLTVNMEYVYDVENNYITTIDIPIDDIKKE